jgi:hypothetical protein
MDDLRNPKPIPFWNCNYQVDFHSPIPRHTDEIAFTKDNETVFTTTLFGKAAGPVVHTPPLLSSSLNIVQTSISSHRTFRIKFGAEEGDTLHELFVSQFKPISVVSCFCVLLCPFVSASHMVSPQQAHLLPPRLSSCRPEEQQR